METRDEKGYATGFLKHERSAESPLEIQLYQRITLDTESYTETLEANAPRVSRSRNVTTLYKMLIDTTIWHASAFNGFVAGICCRVANQGLGS
jgi:hypothetical protein